MPPRPHKLEWGTEVQWQVAYIATYKMISIDASQILARVAKKNGSNNMNITS